MSNGKSCDPYCHHKKPGSDSQQQTTVGLSMVFSGCMAQVPRGVTFQPNAMAIIGRFPAGSIGGAKQDFGSRFGQA
jgi:hypothetical protein